MYTSPHISTSIVEEIPFGGHRNEVIISHLGCIPSKRQGFAQKHFNISSLRLKQSTGNVRLTVVKVTLPMVNLTLTVVNFTLTVVCLTLTTVCLSLTKVYATLTRVCLRLTKVCSGLTTVCLTLTKDCLALTRGLLIQTKDYLVSTKGNVRLPQLFSFDFVGVFRECSLRPGEFPLNIKHLIVYY